MKPPGRANLLAVVAALLVIALGATFAVAHLAGASDGARLEPGQDVWEPDGVIVTPLDARPDGLRAGDVVLAVDGVSLEASATALLRSGAPRSEWRIGQTLTYTVRRQGARLEVPVPLGRYPLAPVLSKSWSTFLFLIAGMLIGTFVFVRRPHDRAARAFFVSSAGLMGAASWLLGLQIRDLAGGPGFWLYLASAVGGWFLFWSAGLHFALVFPRPLPVVTRHPPLIPLVYAAPYTFYALTAALTAPGAASTIEWIGRWRLGEYGTALVYLILIIAALGVSYRSSDRTARQQIRWVVFAAALCGGTGLVLWILPGAMLGRAIISVNALGLILLPFPAAIAIAVLRHRLFDIDVIINRTLVYGTLTTALGLIYALSVVVLQALLRRVTGQDSDLAIIAATLGIAALFSPLRRRIQEFIDRRFYRRHYDAEQVMAAFGATIRHETDLDQLSAALLAVVEETMQPAHISLWLREPSRLKVES